MNPGKQLRHDETGLYLLTIHIGIGMIKVTTSSISKRHTEIVIVEVLKEKFPINIL